MMATLTTRDVVTHEIYASQGDWHGQARHLYRVTLNCGHDALVAVVVPPVRMACPQCATGPYQMVLPLVLQRSTPFGYAPRPSRVAS